jgi:thioredoxin 1
LIISANDITSQRSTGSSLKETKATAGKTHRAQPGKELIMAVISVNEQNYQEVIGSGKTVLLDFYADWCGPCRRVSPLVERLAEEHPEYAVGKVNVDDEQELAVKFGVMSIPMLAVIKGGELVAKNVGAIPYEAILDLVQKA